MTNAAAVLTGERAPMIEKERYLRIIETALTGSRMIDTTKLSKQDWLAIRQLLGIGASETSVVLGINRYKSPFHLWQEKVSDSISFVENNFTTWGNLLEEPEAQDYARKTGNTVLVDKNIRIHPVYDNIFVNLDRLVIDEATGEKGILECKSTVKRVYDSWVKNEEDCVQGIPLEYYCQIQQQLSVTGAPWCDLITLILDGRETYIKRIIPDLEYIKKQDAVLQAWWNEYVVPMIPPPMNAEEYSCVEPVIGSFREAEPDVMAKLDKLTETKKNIKALKKEEEVAENEIKEFLGENENLTYGGKIVATWKTSLVNRVDGDFLKKNYPDVAKAVTFAKPQRTFRVK